MTKPDDPVMIIVRGDAIALGSVQAPCALQRHRVVVLWRQASGLALAVEGVGAVFIAAVRPDGSVQF